MERFAGPGIRQELHGRMVDCSDADNLCVRAVRAFCREAEISPEGFLVRLLKQIPVSAGFGGGSADAAAVLLEMQHLCGRLPKRKVLEIAVGLGADVPFFLEQRPCLAEGIGELLHPVEIKARYACVLAYPGLPSPVKWAYDNWFRPEGKLPPCWEKLPEALKSAEEMAAFCWNDLGFALERKYPILGMIREEMAKAGALATAVAGSGSGVFALCTDEEQARELRCRMKMNFCSVEFF